MYRLPKVRSEDLTIGGRYFYGRITVNVAPPPGVSETVIFPFWREMISFAMESPSPKAAL